LVTTEGQLETAQDMEWKARRAEREAGVARASAWKDHLAAQDAHEQIKSLSSLQTENQRLQHEVLVLRTALKYDRKSNDEPEDREIDKLRMKSRQFQQEIEVLRNALKNDRKEKGGSGIGGHLKVVEDLKHEVEVLKLALKQATGGGPLQEMVLQNDEAMSSLREENKELRHEIQLLLSTSQQGNGNSTTAEKIKIHQLVQEVNEAHSVLNQFSEELLASEKEIQRLRVDVSRMTAERDALSAELERIGMSSAELANVIKDVHVAVGDASEKNKFLLSENKQYREMLSSLQHQRSSPIAFPKAHQSVFEDLKKAEMKLIALETSLHSGHDKREALKAELKALHHY